MNTLTSISKVVNWKTTDGQRLQPLGMSLSLLYFGVPAALVYLSFHWGMPFLRSLGWPVFISYDLALTVPMALLLCAALAAYRLEGHPLDWVHFKERFRLSRMDRKNGLWVPGLVLMMNLGYGAFSVVTRLMIANGTFSLPALAPRFMDPRFAFTPQALIDLYGGEVVGNAWIVVGFLVLLFSISLAKSYGGAV
jgi:hypothetical protein